MPGPAGLFSHSTAEEAVSSSEEQEEEEEQKVEVKGALYTVNIPSCCVAPLGRRGNDEGRLSFRRRPRDFAGCSRCCTFTQSKEVKAEFSPLIHAFKIKYLLD